MTGKAVVTGGAGFVGSHLAEELSRRGYQVIILDDLSTGKLENIRTPISPCHSEPFVSCHSERAKRPKNLARGKLRKESPTTVDFVQGSVTDLPLLRELFHGVDCVFHLAAIPSVPRSIENPRASHEVNITGTLNVLLAARDNSVRKVICASSSSVYGDTPSLPKREDMPPNPQSPYAVTKLAAEYYCQVFQRVYNLNTVCLRYFNIYGPRQDPNSQYAAVIPLFITTISRGKPPTIFGDGEQTRDFTFVKDAVAAAILAAESDATGIFNVGTGNKVTINELAEIVLELTGNDLKPVHQKPRPGDIRYSLADISKARQVGYNPKYDLERGLKETIRRFHNI